MRERETFLGRQGEHPPAREERPPVQEENPPAPAILWEAAAKQTLREPKVPPRVRRSPNHPSTATDFTVLISWKLTTTFLRE
jgi:hypothetical protein